MKKEQTKPHQVLIEFIPDFSKLDAELKKYEAKIIRITRKAEKLGKTKIK